MVISQAFFGAIASSGAAVPYLKQAYGGVITQYTDSGTTYRCHTFRGDGNFEVIVGGKVDYLIVAGGGGGGVNFGAPGADPDRKDRDELMDEIQGIIERHVDPDSWIDDAHSIDRLNSNFIIRGDLLKTPRTLGPRKSQKATQQ